MKVHLGFLNGFLDECNRVLSAKLAFTKQSTDEIEEKIETIAQELGKLDNTRNEEIQISKEILRHFLMMLHINCITIFITTNSKQQFLTIQITLLDGQ